MFLKFTNTSSTRFHPSLVAIIHQTLSGRSRSSLRAHHGIGNTLISHFTVQSVSRIEFLSRTIVNSARCALESITREHGNRLADIITLTHDEGKRGHFRDRSHGHENDPWINRNRRFNYSCLLSCCTRRNVFIARYREKEKKKK